MFYLNRELIDSVYDLENGYKVCVLFETISQVDMANDRERKCSVCGKVGHHDARNSFCNQID